MFAWAPHSLQRMSSHTEMRRRRIRCWEDSVELFGRGLNLESWHVGVFTPRLARRPLLVKGVTAGTLGIPESLSSSCHPPTFYIGHWFPLVHPTSHHHHIFFFPHPAVIIDSSIPQSGFKWAGPRLQGFLRLYFQPHTTSHIVFIASIVEALSSQLSGI